MQSFETAIVLSDISYEREAQIAKWGEQNHPDGTVQDGFASGLTDRWISDRVREDCERAFAKGVGTWRDILKEEVYEAFAESDPEKLRAELIQVAAVAVAWCEAIDRRKS